MWFTGEYILLSLPLRLPCNTVAAMIYAKRNRMTANVWSMTVVKQTTPCNPAHISGSALNWKYNKETSGYWYVTQLLLYTKIRFHWTPVTRQRTGLSEWVFGIIFYFFVTFKISYVKLKCVLFRLKKVIFLLHIMHMHTWCVNWYLLWTFENLPKLIKNLKDLGTLYLHVPVIRYRLT